MRLAVFAYSRQGCLTARRIREQLPEEEVTLCTVQRLLTPDFAGIPKNSGAFYGQLFAKMDGLIFVGACGIAVRSIAPHIKNKQTDPAVLVVDEGASFVIPVLSGHIGGANALARRLGERLEAAPVITTATDSNGRFSVDQWAAERGFLIGDMALAKEVSAAILEGSVPFCSDIPINAPYPAGLVPGTAGQLGIYLGYRRTDPFERTLRIIPPVLHLGIGCRRGTPTEDIAFAVDRVFAENALERRAVKLAASIDLKAGEEGLLSFCRDRKIPLRFYSAQELMSLEGEFSTSAFVQSVTGADNVCERAAMLGATELPVRKTVVNAVTVAVAAEKPEVDFG